VSYKIKISSIIIAKNEATNIGRCIESQIQCIDDIVVLVDNSSTDNTLQIVQSYKKVNFAEVKWQGYSATKTLALEKTKYDWVLWIDADEALTNELCLELNNFKKSQPQYSAYSFARRAYFLDKWIKHSGWYPARVVRLFDKNKAKFNNSKVHEQLIVNGDIGHFKNDLEHYTDPDIQHYLEKFNNYTTLAAEELNNKGKEATLKDILLRPVFLFFKMYIFKLGFLDGYYGFILARYSAFYVFTKYSKLRELNRVNKI
jgi:glycosyltransferase involved in cell wall biosynthesis